MDEGLLKLTASDIQPDGGNSLDLALKTLHDAEDKVKIVVAKRFDDAVQQEDLASVERFFKIFPLIKRQP